MSKAVECEYCEPDCTVCEGEIDCIFCLCGINRDTNINCNRCEHDLTYCTCPDEQVEKDINEMLEKLKNFY